MLKVDEETLATANESIEKLSILLRACYSGSKLEPKQVTAAIKKGSVASDRLKKYLNIES